MSDGAKLTSDASLLGVYRRALAGVLSLVPFVILSGVALITFACAREAEPLGPGLPADLPYYLGQLQSLKVPPEVERLDWIPSTLKELDASYTAVTAVPLIPGLERLALRATKLTRLPALPASLRELDISHTQIEGPWVLPRNLEALALAGDHIRSLEGIKGLPLLSLELEDMRSLRSSAGLPPTLLSLSISGTVFPELVEIPPFLQELHLTNNRIQALKGLPETIQKMTLDSNFGMVVELPRSLLSLKVAGPQKLHFPVDGLSFLNHLDLQAKAGFDVLPPLLRDLRLSARSWCHEQPPAPKWCPEFPLVLRRLEIGDIQVSEEDDLPKLPSSLNYLYIKDMSMLGRGWLPAMVETTMDATGTGIPIKKLPGSLRHLIYRFCPLAGVDFGTLADLPKELRSLNLEGSVQLTSLEALPPKLEHLDVSETSLTVLPALPNTLTKLDISNTDISSIQGLESLTRLRKLTLHAGQLHSLVGLPKSVTDLHFEESRPGRHD